MQLIRKFASTAAAAASLYAAFWFGEQRGAATVDVSVTREYKACVDTVRRVGEINAKYHRELDALRK